MDWLLYLLLGAGLGFWLGKKNGVKEGRVVGWAQTKIAAPLIAFLEKKGMVVEIGIYERMVRGEKVTPEEEKKVELALADALSARK